MDNWDMATSSEWEGGEGRRRRGEGGGEGRVEERGR